MKTFLALSALLLRFNIGFCQTDTLSDIFVNIMKTEFEAFQKKDPTQWLKYVDDNAIFTNAENFYKTREQIAEEMKNPPDIFASATEVYSNVVVRIFENTAVLSCISTFSFNDSSGNTNEVKFKFTRVHIRDDSGWRLVYHSAIPI